MFMSVLEQGSGEATLGLTIFQVDAFTDRKFAGNPAAVCLLVSRAMRSGCRTPRAR